VSQKSVLNKQTKQTKCKEVVIKLSRENICNYSETIDSFSILEHPHVAHRHAVVIPWSTETYSKSELGSGVDLSWISFDNVLVRFIEDIELPS